eukprot:5638135-Prymnesium_polylepis.1
MGVRIVTLRMLDSRLSTSAPARWEIIHHTVDLHHAAPDALRLAVHERGIMPSGTSGTGLFVIAFDETLQADCISLVAIASFSNSRCGVWRPIDQVLLPHEVGPPPAVLSTPPRKPTAASASLTDLCSAAPTRRVDDDRLRPMAVRVRPRLDLVPVGRCTHVRPPTSIFGA